MSTALSVVFLYAASVIPTAKLALCFLTSLMPWIPLRERGGFVYALLSYAATGAICFFLIPNKLYFAAYILFFGCYGMIKLGIDSVIRDKLVAFAAKLILCNGLAALVIFGAGKLFSLDIIAQLPNYPLYIIIPAIEIFFIAYELVFTLCVRVFDDRLRNVIITLRRRSKPTTAPIPRFLPITHPNRPRRMAALLFTKAKEQSKIQPS